jgi:peptidoglycan/LPS O-acetylase OafA/YrhL
LAAVLTPLPYLRTERSLFMAGMVLSALGFCLLDGRRYRPGAYVFMRLGVTGYLAASIIGVVAETLELTSTTVYPMIVVYVTIAFLSQAAIGCALAMSELIPRWIGWATAVWNLGFLTYLVLARPWDVYFPIFHLIMPVLIGAALILRRRRESAPEADLADIQVG